MKHFVTQVIRYLLLTLFLGYLLEFFVLPYNNNQMTFKNNLIINGSEKEVLVLGNSHTFFGINPEKSSFKMINVANKGRKIETDMFLLKQAVKTMPNLKFVIIPVSHYTLLANKLGEKEKRLYYKYYRITNYKQLFWKNYLLLNEPFKELIDNTLFGLKGNHYLKINSLGWRANKNIYDKNIKETKDRIKNMEGKNPLSNKNLKANIKIIDDIITFSEKRQYKLVLLIPPYHPDYYLYSNNDYHRFISEILFKKKTENILIIEGKKMNIKPNEFFENSDHLNVKGAMVFTKKLDSILRSSLRRRND